MKLSLVSLVRFSQLIQTLPTKSKANAGNDSKANPSLPTNTAVKINVHTGRIPPTAGTTREASNFCNPEKNATRPKMYKNPASSPNTIYRGSGISKKPKGTRTKPTPPNKPMAKAYTFGFWIGPASKNLSSSATTARTKYAPRAMNIHIHYESSMNNFSIIS